MVAHHIRNCLIAWAVAATVLPQTSIAQLDWRQTLEPTTSRAALTDCLLSLEIDNPDVIWSLFENTTRTFLQEAASFEAAMKRGIGDDALTRWQRIRLWRDTRRQLQLQFEDDVALILDDRQLVGTSNALVSEAEESDHEGADYLAVGATSGGGTLRWRRGAGARLAQSWAQDGHIVRERGGRHRCAQEALRCYRCA